MITSISKIFLKIKWVNMGKALWAVPVSQEACNTPNNCYYYFYFSFHLSFCQRQFVCHVVERFYCLHELSSAVSNQWYLKSSLRFYISNWFSDDKFLTGQQIKYTWICHWISKFKSILHIWENILFTFSFIAFFTEGSI